MTVCKANKRVCVLNFTAPQNASAQKSDKLPFPNTDNLFAQDIRSEFSNKSDMMLCQPVWCPASPNIDNSIKSIQTFDFNFQVHKISLEKEEQKWKHILEKRVTNISHSITVHDL